MSHRDWRQIGRSWWDSEETEPAPPRPRIAPGKRTLTMGLRPRAREEAPPAATQRKQDPAAGPATTVERTNTAARSDSWMAVAIRPDLHPAALHPAARRPAPAAIQRKRSADARAQESQIPGHTTSTGRPMPADVAAKMERAFGTDFSEVRIHEGPGARSLGALAYTQGTDIHFAPGQYQPNSPSGQELLGHELAHVVQQSEGRVQSTGQAKGVGVNNDAALEREADALGARAARGERGLGGGQASPRSAGVIVQRKTAPDVDPVVAAEYVKWPSLNKMGRVFAPNAKLFPIASTKSSPVATLKQKELVFVEKVSGNGWLHVTTAEGASGYLADVGFHQQKPKTVFVNTISPADPAADIYEIQSGDTALSVAQKHYGSYIRPGHDGRYFIGVLAWANGRGSDSSKGIFHKEGKDVKNWEANWFSASSWEKCAVVANRWIWVPTASFARQLESEITDGSLTNGLWSQVEDVAEAIAGGAAFVAGVVAGAVQSIWDLITGLVDLGKILVKTIKSLITGNIVSDVSELVSKLADLDIGELIVKGFGKLADSWNQDDLLDRWYFRGKVIGYILAEILMLVFTGGAAAAKWAGRFGKLGATLAKSTAVTRFANGAQKVVDKGGDAVRYAKNALRGTKTDELADAGKALDKAGDAGKAEIRSGVKEDPGPLMRGGSLSPHQEALAKGLDSTEGLGKGLLAVGKSEVTATDLAALTKHSGVEHALVLLKDNRRVLVKMDSYKGGSLPANTKTLLMHSHPSDRGSGMAKFISAEDVEAIKFLNQEYSYMVTVDGTIYRFTQKTVPMTIGEVVRKPPHPILVWAQN